MPKPAVNEPKVVNQPKVRSDAPIIEEYESDNEDEHVSQPTKEQEQPSFGCTNKQVKTPRETVNYQFTHSKNPIVNKKGLGYGFTARECFVCGSLSHLIRDCDFHEKRMTKQAELNNSMRMKSSQREIRPIWNNVASGTNNVSTARHHFNRQTVPTNAAIKVNTVKPIVNIVNTTEVNAVSAVGEKGKLLLSPQQVVIGDHKDTTGTMSPNTMDYPHRALQNKGIVDSGCSRHMTGNKAYLAEYQDFNGGPVAFGGSKGYITGKGKIKTGKLDFEDVCFVKELQHFNLFSVSQMCDKKNKVLFTDSECLVLSPEFKLPDENQVLLRIPRQNNMYSFNLENIVPSGGLACLIAKATIDESNKWHRRLGHVNFKNLNKLVKGNLVRGLPSKIFQNDHTCVACQKGKQHKASCKAKSVSSISHSLQLLHMDLFGPTSVRSLNHKTYCLVITDDFSRDFIEFCGSKGIKREYSNARTPQQNGVAKRKNRTLIEDARTMLADSFLPNTFWAEAVSTACYVLNRVILKKKTNVLRTTLYYLYGLLILQQSRDQQKRMQMKHLKLSGRNLPKKLRICFYKQELLKLADIYKNPTDGIFTNSSYDDEGAVADFINLETVVNVSPIPTSRINYIHPSTLILRDPQSPVQTRSKVSKSSGAHAFKNSEALEDESWVDVMQEELLQFKIQKGHRQEEGIDYDEVFAPVARIEAIGIFLAFTSYMGFIVYQMDVKSTFLYGKIDEKVYVSQPPGFIDPKYPQKVYKVVKALYGLHQAPRAWYATLSTFLLKNGYRRGTIDKTLFIKKDKHDIILVQVYVDDIIFGSTKKSWCDEFEALMKSRFQMSSMGELTLFLGLQVKQKKDGIFISQDKYVVEILKKFDFVSVKTASTPIETQKPLVKDKATIDVDVHLYRSMIGSLMYVSASRLDIMFAVCACSRVSSFDLEAYSNSDYAGGNLDRKSTTGEAEYVAAANCCGQVLWIQNQMLDYGFNFMNTKIYIDNESTICIIKNPVYHSKTKYIDIRHHFIRDAYEKKLIQVLKIHTDDNVADLLTKAFDVSRFQFLVVTIGMINP
ncbi:putative ribonuclease H-like domain-containing protein [Tanacetum coccineum]